MAILCMQCPEPATARAHANGGPVMHFCPTHLRRFQDACREACIGAQLEAVEPIDESEARR